MVAALGSASDRFLATIADVTDWEAPGLGEWTVRELVAHTLRAYTTVETYLDAPVADGPIVDDAVEYYRVALAAPDVHAAVAARGREAGRALTDPAAQARETAERLLTRVRSTPHDRVMHSAAGPIGFTDYLATRTVELTLHTLDLQRAIGALQEAPADAVDLCLDVLLPLADPTELLLSITGRADVHVLG